MIKVLFILVIVGLLLGSWLHRHNIPPFDLVSSEEFMHTYVWPDSVRGDRTLMIEIKDNGNYPGNPSPKEWRAFAKAVTYETFNYTYYIKFIEEARK
jgi:hypothetical protein